MARKEFNLQAKNDGVDAKCKRCNKTAHQTQLNLHHKNGDSSDMIGKTL